MADNESIFSIKTETTFDPNTQALMDLMKKEQPFIMRMRGETQGGAARSSSPSGASTPRASSDVDLDRRYKNQYIKTSTEQMKVWRTGGAIQGIGAGAYSLAMGGGLSGIFKGLSNELQRGEAMRRDGTWISNIASGAVGARVARGAENMATAAKAEAAAGAAGTTEAVTIGTVASLLKKPSVQAAIAAAAIAADYVVATRGAARGKYAAGLGASVGGVSAAQLGFERYIDPDNVMNARR